LNSQFAVECASAFARRVATEAGSDPSARIELSFVLACGRPPTEQERSAAVRFLAEQPSQYAATEKTDDLVWRDFCQMLLASNAFLYIE
jgi:hypothetical protein